MNAKKARKLRIVVRELAGDQQEVLTNEPHEIEIALRGSDGKETGEKVKGYRFTKRHKGPRSFYKQLKKDVQESRSVKEEPVEVVENRASDFLEALQHASDLVQTGEGVKPVVPMEVSDVKND